MDAIDFIVDETEILIESQMMTDLKTATMARKQAIDLYDSNSQEGSDKGHEHYLQVLAYCWGKLRSRRNSHQRGSTPKSVREETKTATADGATNWFQHLSLEETEDDDDDEDDEDVPVLVPESRPEIPEALTLKELLQSDISMNVTLFFLSLNEHMKFVAKQYREIKAICRNDKTNENKTIVPKLMEAAASVNYFIQSVAFLEQELMALHPDLTTIYRILAVHIMPDITQTLTEKMRKSSSPRASEFSEIDAIAFLGDVIECAFLYRNCYKDVCYEFAQKWACDVTEALSFGFAMQYFAKVESPYSAKEIDQDWQNLEMGRKYIGKVSSHSWLRIFDYIGGDRSLTSTLRLVQVTGNVIYDSPGLVLVPKEGFFGKEWDENHSMASKIQGDLNEYLSGSILPVMIDMCQFDIVSGECAYERELLALFTEFKAFIKHPLKAVSSSLVFGVHALLVAIMEIQGDDDVRNIGLEAKRCNDRFFAQVEWAKKVANDSNNPRVARWHENMDNLLRIRRFTQPEYAPVDASPTRANFQKQRAVWNPLCAGTHLLYLSYMGNLLYGLEMLDSLDRFHSALHIYNGFKQCGILHPGQVPLLDFLDQVFKKSKAIWEGTALPDKGELYFRFLISRGFKIEVARTLSNDVRLRLLNGGLSGRTPIEGEATRKRTFIRPELVSKSYRIMCLHDFSELEEKQLLIGQVVHGRLRTTKIADSSSQACALIAALQADLPLNNTNPTSVSEILEQYHQNSCIH